MGKIGANGNLVFLLPMVFLAMSSIVGAVDVIFYSNASACAGSGFSFNGVDEQVCCVADGGSVLFTDMEGCKTSRVYRNGGCSRDEVGSDAVGSDTGDVCWIGGNFTSGYWVESCRRRSLLAEVESQTTECQGLTKPTGLVFTDAGTKSTWVLTAPNAEELFSQLESLPHGEKANWIQSKGASLLP